VPPELLTIQPVVWAVLAVCAIAAVALSTGKRVAASVRNRREAKLLARALDELESIKRLHDDDRQLLNARLTSIEHALETLTVEMERVGEGQRFVTRLIAPRADGEQSGR